MTRKILYTIVFLIAAGNISIAFAQKIPSKSWDIEKIKGTRFLPNPSYDGSSFLTDTWVVGKVELADGMVIDSLNLRFNSYKDELVYYNQSNASQIVLDKQNMNGFEFQGKDGLSRVFRKQYYDSFGKGDRYFEVLSTGENDLLAYRKVSLNTSSIYKDDLGKLKNMVFEKDYHFYFYSRDKGYTAVKINFASLLSKFSKPDQKQIKKLLRKNRIRVSDEPSFVRAWETIEKEGYKVVF